MSNINLIVHNSPMLTTQMADKASKILGKYRTFDIQTRMALLQQLFSANNKYYEQYGSSSAYDRIIDDLPMFEGPPISEDWNDLQVAIVDDLNVLYGEQIAIRDILNDIKNYNRVEYDFLQQASNRLTNEVASFTAEKKSGAGSIKWYAGDDFKGTTKIDSSNTSATVMSGNVELAREGKEDYSDAAAVALSDRFVDLSSHPPIKGMFDRLFGSTKNDYCVGNGLPGDRHQAYLRPGRAGEADYQTSIHLAGIQSGWKVEFNGAENVRANIAEVIDDNPSTWFEYEVCNVPDSDKQTAQWYGFDAIESDPSGVIRRVPWYGFTDGSGKSIIESEIAPPSTTQAAQYGYSNRGYDSDVSKENSGSTGHQIEMVHSYSGEPTPNETSSNPEPAVTGAPKSGASLRLVINLVLFEEKIIDSVSITPKVIAGKRPTAALVEVRSDKFDNWQKAIPLSGRAARIYRKSGDTVSVEQSVISDLVDVEDPIGAFESGGNEGSNTWVLPKPQPVRAIRIVLEQPQSYATEIGHIVYGLRIVTETTSSHSPGWLSGLLGFDHAHSETSTSVQEIRIPGGDMSLNAMYANAATIKQGGVWVAIGMAASMLLGVGGYGGIAALVSGMSVAGAVGGAVLGAGTGAIGALGVAIAGALIIGAIISGFFGSDSTSTAQTKTIIGPFVERFKNGWRYAVAVRDISILATRYEETSELQSVGFISPFDIKRVSLIVSETIPSQKYAPGFTTDTEWIEYYISFDSGTTWHPIAPKSHVRSVKPKVYYVNVDNDGVKRSMLYGYVSTTAGDDDNREAYSIRLKAVLKRPPSDPTFTPRLHGYRILMEGTS